MDDPVATGDQPNTESGLSPQTKGDGTSSEQKGTSDQTPEFTPEEQAYIDGQKTKAVSDALSASGRTQAILDAREKVVKDGEEALTTGRMAHQTSVERTEDAAAEGNPELLADIRTRRQRDKAQVALDVQKANQEAREATLQEQEKLARGTVLEQLVGRVAAELKVDPKMLLSHGGETEESVRALAKVLTKVPDPVDAPKADSGVTKGSGEVSDEEKLKKRYPSMP